MVFEGLKKRIEASKEAQREAKAQAEEDKALYRHEFAKQYGREKGKALSAQAKKNAAVAARQEAARFTAPSPAPAGGRLGQVGHVLAVGGRGFQKYGPQVAKYGKSDPFGVLGESGSGGTDYGLGSILGSGGKKASSQPDYLGLGSLGIGEPERPQRKKRSSSKGKTIVIRVK